MDRASKANFVICGGWFVLGENSIDNQRDCSLSTERFMPKVTDIMLEKSFHPTMKLYYNVSTQPYSLREIPSPK